MAALHTPKRVDALSVVQSRPDMAGVAEAGLPLKPATLSRALKIYLFGFFGALAVTALLLLEPAVRGTAANRDARLAATSQPSVEVLVPEARPDTFAITVAPEASPSLPVEMDAGKAAMATASLPDAPVPKAPAPSAIMDIAAFPSPAPGIDTAAIETAAASSAATPSDSALTGAPPDVVVTPIPSHPRPAPGISQSAAAARPAPGAGRRGKSQQIVGAPVRSRRALPRDPAIGRTAEPPLRGSEGAGCPAGSDPRWSAPDGSGVSALICNPYYPRVSVSVF